MNDLQEADLRDLRLHRLYQYWLSRHISDRPPGRAHLDPLDFRYAIGLVSLIDVEQATRRFRFRLVAGAVTEHLGYEMTGRYLDEVPEEGMRAYLDEAYQRVVGRRQALHENGERVIDRRIWRHESMLLPCCADDGAVNLIISARVTHRPQALDATRGDRR